MSPKIGMRFKVGGYATVTRRPLDRARVAVNVVEAQGMRVVLDGEHGVGQHAITRGWVAEGPHHPRRVSILGAVCLAWQPQEGPTVEAGALEALDVSPDWLRGLWDGFHAGADVEQLTGPSRELYLDGLRAGHLLFAELTTECRECGKRRHKNAPICRGCG